MRILNSSYARRHFFLPVFIGLGEFLYNLPYIYLVQGGLRADRQVARYISSQTVPNLRQSLLG